MNAEDVIRLLDLAPLRWEGGYFRETWRSAAAVSEAGLPEVYRGRRSFGTAIYYLITPESFSTIHRVRGDEVFHFYFGDEAEMLLLQAGRAEKVRLGSDLASGQRPQIVVPGGVWQGMRLVDGGRFALLGTTMAPGFDPSDFEIGNREALIREFPGWEEVILRYTRATE